MSRYPKVGIRGILERSIVESTAGAAETLSSNRHPTARSPVSAGHKRITDTLPTVNPRLRAPLPPAAVAPARIGTRAAEFRAGTRGGICPRSFTPEPPTKPRSQGQTQNNNKKHKHRRFSSEQTLLRRRGRCSHAPPATQQPKARAPPQPSSSYRAPGSRGPFAGS